MNSCGNIALTMHSHSTVTATPTQRPDSGAEGVDLRGGEQDRPLPVRTIALGAVAALLLLAGSIGGAGILVDDPILGSGPLSAFRYGHGKDIATAVIYLGFGLLVWAWIRLGRGVLAHLVDSRGVLIATLAWIAPLLIAPPMFTRDVYSYLGQGLLALHGIDPYTVGPATLTGSIPENVHWIWQSTPAPYGPLFIALSKGVILLAGESMVSSIILMRIALLGGLVMLIFALPGLVRHLGGRLPVALWLAAASPLTVVHLVGGPHNDMLVVGLLAIGTVTMLDGKYLRGIALVSLAVAIKATAALALPFLVWLWASRLSGPQWQRFARAVLPALLAFGAVFGSSMVVAKVDFGWISALSAPGKVVNFLSAPTAVGQLAHAIVGSFVQVDPDIFIDIGRALGTLALFGFVAWQWWLARAGGTDAVRRGTIVLFVGAALSPAVHPWYLTWAMALACAFHWTSRGLSYVVGATVALVLCYYPDGEQAMYNWLMLGIALCAGLLAGLSLTRFDPLGLNRLFRPDPTAEPVTSGTLRT